MTLLVRSVVEVNLKEIQQIYSRDFSPYVSVQPTKLLLTSGTDFFYCNSSCLSYLRSSLIGRLNNFLLPSLYI